MAEITHDDNINVLNAATPPILNGTVHCTNVEHVDKQHMDMRHEHVKDDSMTMGFVAITT
jgi:mRNA-degrading endonuclease toxin of MazEF toxin-antitoxin module